MLLWSQAARYSGNNLVTVTNKVSGKRNIWPHVDLKLFKTLNPNLDWMIKSSTPYKFTKFCGNLCFPYCWNITYLWFCVPFLSFLFADRTKHSLIGSWHYNVVCLSIRPSVHLSFCLFVCNTMHSGAHSAPPLAQYANGKYFRCLQTM